MIRDIFIDLDNTILDFDAGEAVALSTAMQKHGIEPAREVLERYHVINKALWEQLEEGLVTRDRLRTERFARLFSELSLDADPELVEQDYADMLSHQHVFMPGAEELLQELKAQGYRLYIASNGTASTQWQRIREAGIEGYFCHIFISEELGANKPDPRFFELAAEAIEDYDSEKAVIIGDSLSSDIRGGIAAGIHTCLYVPEGRQLPVREDVVPEHVVRRLSEVPGLLIKM